MMPAYHTALALCGFAGMLAACDSPAPVAERVGNETPAPTGQIAASAAPAEPSRSRDPAIVLAAWARAIEARDWALVRQYWGNHGEESGANAGAFAARWSALTAPAVQIGMGREEGAAGSLYYTAPITIMDGPRRIAGEVTLRRANDVPGATAEQLRWHIDGTTLDLPKPADR